MTPKFSPGYPTKAVVVTDISARHMNEDRGDDQNIRDMDMENGQSREERQYGENSFHLGQIKVRTDHVIEEWRETDMDRKSDGDGKSSGSVDQATFGSTREFVHRDEDE